MTDRDAVSQVYKESERVVTSATAARAAALHVQLTLLHSCMPLLCCAVLCCAVLCCAVLCAGQSDFWLLPQFCSMPVSHTC